MSNTLKTTALLGLLTGLLLFIGDRMGGPQGMIIGFGIAIAMNFGSYWFSDRVVLRMYRGQELSQDDAPELVNMVRELATTAQLPMPKVYLIPSDSPNAFATGRNPSHAAVAVTRGITRMLDRDELRGVLAHELGHVANRDTLISAIAATMAGVIIMVARWGMFFGGMRRDGEGGGGGIGGIVMFFLAPVAAGLIQMAISRSREFGADAFAGRVTRNPGALASALEKISSGAQRVPMDAGPATAHLFIMNPLGSGGIRGLFSTHPPTEERVRRLRDMVV